MIAVQKTHRAVLVMEIVMDSMIVRDRSLVGRKTVHGEMRMIVAEQVGNLLYALCVVWISFNNRFIYKGCLDDFIPGFLGGVQNSSMYLA